MPLEYGGQMPTDASTMRDRDWPCLRQFCVFLENRVGVLQDLMQHLERDNLRVMGLSIVDSIDCAIVRLVLNDYERGRELFNLASFTMFETDLIGVELPDDPQPYVKICTALMRAEVNIHYSYPLLFRRRGRGAVAFYVDDIDQGLVAMGESELTIITENDLPEDDEFF